MHPTRRLAIHPEGYSLYMLYRLYRPADFPHLYAIELLCFQPPIRFSHRYMQKLVSSVDSATWIAEEDGQMAGFAIAEWIREPENTIAYIQTLEVAPSYRKQGIANELLRRCESSARAAGSTMIDLHVAEQNIPAIHLYLAHGYLQQGREQDYYADAMHALVFSRSLE